MSVDIQSPKITWAAIISVITLAFSSGTGWVSIFNNKDTNASQWRRINALEAKVESYSTLPDTIRAYEASNKELSSAIVSLTIATQVSSEQSKANAAQRSRDTMIINQISQDITNLKIQVGRIQEKILK